MNIKRRFRLLALVTAMLGLGSLVAAQDPPDPADKLRTWLKDSAADFWIYDDLEAGHAQAKDTGKPLLVSIRCVP